MLTMGCERSCQGDGVTADDSRKVVVLVMDGARMDESFGEGYSTAAERPTAELLPRLRSELLPQGTLIKPGYSLGITVTGPGHCDMLTAHRQVFANYANPDGVDAYLPTLPTIFEAVRDSTGLDSSAVILMGNTTLIEPLKTSLYPSSPGGASFFTVDESQSTDAAVLEQAQVLIERYAPRLLVANLHAIDRGGHYGENGEYVQNIELADGAIADFWQWLSAQEGYAGNTVLVIAADHGRHRLGEEDDWRNHGDHCAGCREVPMLLLGDGIRAGVVSTTPYTLEDLGHTIAALLDTEVPYSEGVLMRDALLDPPDHPGSTGSISPAVAGDLVAAEVRTGQAQVRSRIALPGLSPADVTAAEAPQLTTNGAGVDFACWRELLIEPDADELPWLGQCWRREGGRWQDIGFPISPVWPLWEPALQADPDGGLWLAFANNPNGLVAETDSVTVLHWTAGDGWLDPLPAYINVTVPSSPAMVLHRGSPVVAFAVSDPDEAGRYTRRIEVHQVDEDGWSELLRIAPSAWPGGEDSGVLPDETLEVARLERPALWLEDGTFRLAFLSHTAEADNGIWMVEGDGEVWGAAERLDSTGQLLGHITPVFTASGEPVWARLGLRQSVELCRAAAGASQCMDTGAQYIDGIAITEGGVLASLRSDGEPWALQELPWPE